MQDMKIFEKLVRKVYHDGVNILGPLREIVRIKLDSTIGDYILKNTSYFLILIKNLRFFYLISNKPEFFEKERFMLSDVIKDILLYLKYYNPPDLNTVLNVELECPEEPLYMIIFNIINNACRFGYDVKIEIKESKLIISNTTIHPIPKEIESIYDFSVTYDRFNIIGAGVGLNIVKKGLEFIKDLKMDCKIGNNLVEVYLDYSNLIV